MDKSISDSASDSAKTKTEGDHPDFFSEVYSLGQTKHGGAVDYETIKRAIKESNDRKPSTQSESKPSLPRDPLPKSHHSNKIIDVETNGITPDSDNFKTSKPGTKQPEPEQEALDKLEDYRPHTIERSVKSDKEKTPEQFTRASGALTALGTLLQLGQELDKNTDGVVDKDELAQVTNKYAGSIYGEHLNYFQKSFDTIKALSKDTLYTNKDGITGNDLNYLGDLSYETTLDADFYKAASKYGRDNFDKLDSNHDKSLSADEINRASTPQLDTDTKLLLAYLHKRATHDYSNGGSVPGFGQYDGYKIFNKLSKHDLNMSLEDRITMTHKAIYGQNYSTEGKELGRIAGSIAGAAIGTGITAASGPVSPVAGYAIVGGSIVAGNEAGYHIGKYIDYKIGEYHYSHSQKANLNRLFKNDPATR